MTMIVCITKRCEALLSKPSLCRLIEIARPLRIGISNDNECVNHKKMRSIAFKTITLSFVKSCFR